MAILTVYNGKDKLEFAFEGEPTIDEVLSANGIFVEKPCGGKGTCGKCRVFAQGNLTPMNDKEKLVNSRLACQSRLIGDAQVVIPKISEIEDIANLENNKNIVLNPMNGKYVIAFDIGTTTLAAGLAQTSSGKILSQVSAENPQRIIAADVIGRIEASMKGKKEFLQALILNSIDKMTESLCSNANINADDVGSIVITGNTTMLYLLTAADADSLSHVPFKADKLFGEWIELNIPSIKNAKTYLPACISSFVGADITCGIIASPMLDKSGVSLLVDVGTNGEIALKTADGKIYTSATAAGPAFEGGGIFMGSSGIKGAIEKVSVENGHLLCKTIGNVKAEGICGSGIIDAVASLLKVDAVEETGAMSKEYTLMDDVKIIPKDIRNIQLAKSAIAAGICTLCSHAGLDFEDIDNYYLAGGFGKHINLDSAVDIGLVPSKLRYKTQAIGNSALEGALMIALQKDNIKKTEDIAKNASAQLLGNDSKFTEYYMDCMMLEPLEDLA